MRPALLLFCLTSLSAALPSSADTLTSVREISKFRINGGERHKPKPFSAHGQVISRLHNEHYPVLAIVHDGFQMYVSDVTGTNDCRVGDLVAMAGYVNNDPRNGLKGIFATEIRRIGKKPLPQTTPLSNFQLNRPERHSLFVSITGVVVGVIPDELHSAFNWITLATPTGFINAYASVDEYPLSEIEKLIDAEVELRGVLKQSDRRLKFVGYPLELFGTGGIRIVTHAPTDPFQAPALAPKELRLHRQLAQGIVRGRTRENLYLETEDGNFLTVQLHPKAPPQDLHVGDPVSAVGFAVQNRCGIQLSKSLVRLREPVGGTSFRGSPPSDISPARLFTDVTGLANVNYEMHGKVIRISGTVRNSQSEILSSGTIRMECNAWSIEIDTTCLSEGIIRKIHPDCALEVTGICTAEFGMPDTDFSFPRFNRFLLIPRRDADLRILSSRPFLRPWHFVSVIAILALIIVIITIWNKSLKVLSERRSRELAAEKITRVQSEIKVEERTRLAVELHDSISQAITGVAFQIDSALSANAGRISSVDAILKMAKMALASCRKELQCCLWDLRSRTFAEKDLTEAIRKTIEPHVGHIKTMIRFNVPRISLSETTTHTILQIVRELVVNAIRHGNATEIRIAGEFHDGTISFSVRDNGIGFNPDTTPGPQQGHFGLRGIRERLGNFDGTLTVESAVGHGSKFLVSLNASQNEPSASALAKP